MKVLLDINDLRTPEILMYPDRMVDSCEKCARTYEPKQAGKFYLSSLNRSFNGLACIDHFHLGNLRTCHIYYVPQLAALYEPLFLTLTWKLLWWLLILTASLNSGLAPLYNLTKSLPMNRFWSPWNFMALNVGQHQLAAQQEHSVIKAQNRTCCVPSADVWWCYTKPVFPSLAVYPNLEWFIRKLHLFFSWNRKKIYEAISNWQSS